MSELASANDATLLDELQRAAFGYFLEAVNPVNGLIADNSRPNAPVSIGVVGFALSAYAVAVERGWMRRADAVERSLTALRFFHGSDQSGSAEATGYKGFYYHFLDRHSGTRVWRSEVSMMDTGLLIAGALTAAMYFTANTPEESELRELADALYRRVDWRWAQNGATTVCHGWKPECGFLVYGWEGYDEAILLYVLALGSPTYPLAKECYEAWTSTYQWENLYGYDCLFAGPLFVHQFPHAWIDFRGIKDDFMRQKCCDYFENSRRATLVNCEYARRNPHGFVGYDADSWGLTACEGPGGEVPGSIGRRQQYFEYAARGAPHGPDDGTLAGWAALGSLPFAPDIAMRAVRNMYRCYPQIRSGDRYTSGYNPTFASAEKRAWVSTRQFGLDQGLVVIMIENYRTGLIWKLMRNCPSIGTGLRRAGFRGGWL